MKYFVSNLHIGKESVAKARGFDSSEEHDLWLGKFLSNSLEHNDKLYILGNIAQRSYKRLSEFFNTYLKGKDITIVLGNQENSTIVKSIVNDRLANKVYGVLRLLINDIPIVLTSNPIHPIELGDKWHHNLYGTSKNYIDDLRYITTSLDNYINNGLLSEKQLTDIINKRNKKI